MAFKSAKNLMIGTAVALASVTGVAIAAGDSVDTGYEMVHKHWHWSGAFGSYDREAMQRGYQVYVEVCRNCHNLDQLAFRHLGDKGGPFYNPEYPNPNDNPLVKNIAAEIEVEDIDADTGDVITRPGIPADYFPPVYPNDAAARAGNGGALPPDLSVINKARTGGADYIYNLLIAYEHPIPEKLKKDQTPGLYFNPVMEGNWIAMPPQLEDGLVEYQTDLEGQNPPEPTMEQLAADVTEFLAWSADPKLDERKTAGFMSLLYLLILAVLLWFSYKRIWARLKQPVSG